MIELLVVMTIIAILVSVVAVASTALIGRARSNSTQSLLTIVNQAVEDFKREKPGIINASQPSPNGTVKYLNRYGPYPPDELEVFVDGIPGHATNAKRSFAPGNAKAVPPQPAYSDMLFYGTGNPKPTLEHRDLAAMILAIETLTESAASVLGQIPDRNRIACLINPLTNEPGQFLDRPANTTAGPDGNFDSNSHEIRLIVDDWGVPLGYFTQRDHNPRATDPLLTASSNHANWNQASTDFVRLNGGAPVIFSWGPDGKDQLTKDVMDTDPPSTASMVGDWVNDPVDGIRPTINNRFNIDNLFANPALKDKLLEGITTQQ